MKPTDTTQYQHFLKVVDCQYACPAHTPVPEYIRLIAQKRYNEAYLLNWHSNVCPGVLGRVCDRPCEPACRRKRVEEEPVAICRLKRMAADHKYNIEPFLTIPASKKNGKRIALIGAGPASLTVARDLLPRGYHVVLYERDQLAGGMMRSQIPDFRLPRKVLNEEINYVVNMGVETHFNEEITSLKALLEKKYNAIFIASGAPKGRWLTIKNHQKNNTEIEIGINWLAKVNFKHLETVAAKVLILGGGNTAMDCSRAAKRLGAKEVSVAVRSSFDEMKASTWEKQDAQAEGIIIKNNLMPIEYVYENKLFKGVLFAQVQSIYDKNHKRSLVPNGNNVFIECDKVLLAIGQDNAFPWIERDLGLKFTDKGLPQLNQISLQSSLKQVFFGGDAAYGPENIISAVAHGHQAAISIDLYCQNKDPQTNRPASHFNLISQKMDINEWSFSSAVTEQERQQVPHVDWHDATIKLTLEVELGFDEQLALAEANRCLNCDVHTVFNEQTCIECAACEDVCPMDCITFIDQKSIEENKQASAHLKVQQVDKNQEILVSKQLKTNSIMLKDEDVCLHCGLCAERCPTGAWDMQKFTLNNIAASIK